VTVVLNGAGAAMSATLNTTPQTASNTTGAGGTMTGTAGTGATPSTGTTPSTAPTPGTGGTGTQLGNPLPVQPLSGQTWWRYGRWHHRLMDPSGA
jgi:hypothetical protein